MLAVSDPATRTISAAGLKKLLDGSASEVPVIVDVRNRDEFEAWQIRGRHPIQTLHVPYFDLLEAADADDVAKAAALYAKEHWTRQLPEEGPIVTVCATGDTSAFVAQGLKDLGYDAVNLEGGMQAWGDHYETVPVVESEELKVYQVVRPARGCLSYVAVSGGEAVVIDPLRHTEPYLKLIEETGAAVVGVFDTHAHADHISSGLDLAKKLEAPYYLHPYDAIHPMDMVPAAFDYVPIKDGDSWRIGRAELKALHVPGHTLGNVVYMLDGSYLFTGDTIFVESVSRPDLGGQAEKWTDLHHASLDRLLKLPGDTVVLPGHYSHPGEADETGLFAASLDQLRRGNEGLLKVQEGSAVFYDYATSSLPFFPEAYIDIKRVNLGLLQVGEEQASELELGPNICALTGEPK